jgi:hypothetical protein
LSQLTIAEDGDAGTALVLRRAAIQPPWAANAHDISIQLVDLADQGRYLCASLTVPASEMSRVIEAAVTEKELEEAWLEWREDAVVTAAVRTDESESSDRRGFFYTFLPMEVEAPFPGHLNAPFYARIDRRDLNRSLSLNSLLLDAGARACRLAAREIASRNQRSLAGASTDYFSWSALECQRLERALGEEEPASGDAILPVLGPGGRTWASLADSYA